MSESMLVHLFQLLPLVIAAAAGALIAPALKLERATAACLAMLVVALLSGAYFVIVGSSPWRWLLLLPPAALWLAPWVQVPFKLYHRPLAQQPHEVEPFDPERHALRGDLLAWMEETAAALEREGFVRVDDVAILLGAGGVVSRLILMDHAAEAARAGIHGYPPRLHTLDHALSLSTVLADGRWLAVSNGLDPSPLPRLREMVGAPLPEVRDAASVLAVFRRFVGETGGDQPRSLPPGTDAKSSFAANLAHTRAQLLERGWYRPMPGGDRMSVRAALFAGWSRLFPVRQIRMLGMRREQDGLLRRLGIRATRAPEPWPVRWWLSFGGLQVVGAVALLAFGVAWPWLANAGGIGSLAGLGMAMRADSVVPERLPGDFSVPADFPGAVAALERLAGAKAQRLIADDGLSGAPTDAMRVPIAKRRIDGLLAAAQPKFLARGFVLFHTQEFSGVHGEPEALAIFPSRDPIDAVLKVNTNGDNYGIGTPEVAAWLREVNREHPFTITSAGFDYVEGRFVRPLTEAEARALAVRVARFCPDVVSQGTGSVAALAREMRRKRGLYCWWD
jgi:hypothetical protein